MTEGFTFGTKEKDVLIFSVIYFLLSFFFGLLDWNNEANWELGAILVFFFLWPLTTGIFSIIIFKLSLRCEKFKYIESATILAYLANCTWSFLVSSHSWYTFFSSFLNSGIVPNYGLIFLIIYLYFILKEIKKNINQHLPVKYLFVKIFIIVLFLFSVNITANALEQNIKNNTYIKENDPQYQNELTNLQKENLCNQQPHPALCSKWINYKNNQVNFSIDYPDSGYLYNSADLYDHIDNSKAVSFYRRNLGNPTVAIYMNFNTQDGLEKYSSSYYQSEDVESKKEIIVSNQPAIQIILKNGVISTFFWRKSDEKIFNIVLYDTGESDMYNKMLNSFKY